MRVEEIALRQEARQMLCEAGLNKESLKELVLKDLNDKVVQAVEKKIKGMDFEGMVERRVEAALTKAVNEIVQKQVSHYFCNHPLKIEATAFFKRNGE